MVRVWNRCVSRFVTVRKHSLKIALQSIVSSLRSELLTAILPITLRAMVDTRLIHDAAFAGADSLTAQVKERLKPEEQKEFHRQAYEVIKASIEGYALRKDHETTRISPRPK